MNQTGLMEDDYMQGLMGFKLRVERISAAESYLYCTICAMNQGSHDNVEGVFNRTFTSCSLG